MAGLARTLIAAGHHVDILCEPVTAIRFGEMTKIEVMDNSKLVDEHFSGDLKQYTTILDVFCDDSPEALEQAEHKRASLLREYLRNSPPDRVVLWNGGFHYQQALLRTLNDFGYRDKTIFCEVAWFPQTEYVYFDCNGVNKNSTIPGTRYPALNLVQSHCLSQWKDQCNRNLGYPKDPMPVSKRVFVPLQVDTDTNIQTGSPFNTMQEFVAFLESWLPEDYEAVIKAHPKAEYEYPLQSNRQNFHFTTTGSIGRHLSEAELVVGINSTVLLEAMALGKPVIALGQGVFNGSGVLTEATPNDTFATAVKKSQDQTDRDSFLYHMAFERQVSIEALKSGEAAHLFTRHPFNAMPCSKSLAPDKLRRNAQEGKIVIRIGNSRISRSACLDVDRNGQILIGHNSEVRHYAVLEVTGGPRGTIEIGNNCVVGVGNWFQGSGQISIGNDVIIGPYVTILSTSHTFKELDRPIADQPMTIGEVVIEDGVWIGAHATINYNVRIGAHSIIGANAFVNQDVPAYSIYTDRTEKRITSRR